MRDDKKSKLKKTIKIQDTRRSNRDQILNDEVEDHT